MPMTGHPTPTVTVGKNCLGSTSGSWDPGTLDQLTTQFEAVKHKESLLFETRHRRKDGATFPVEVSSRLIEYGGESYCQSIIRDITERNQAAEVLRKSEASLLRAQQIGHVGSWEVDLSKE